MKSVEQQELFDRVADFYETKEEQSFQRMLGSMFRCPLWFPVGTGKNKGRFVLGQQKDVSFFTAFTDEEEAAKGALEGVTFVPYSLEEYASLIANSSAMGLIINPFVPKNCMINKDFFAEVVCKAFAENRVMPGLKAADGGEYVEVRKVPFVIGRSSDADLVIADKTISPYHALIIERENKYYVLDKDSLNGVYVNGEPVEKGKEQEIVFDDVIAFCDVEYSFVPLGLAQRNPVSQSIYGDDRAMIANAMFLMQNTILMREFLERGENLRQQMASEDANKQFQQYFLMALELTCGVKEKEQNITDQTVIEQQRTQMLQKGMAIFREGDFGFRRAKSEREIYVAQFPAVLHIPGLAKRIYFAQNADGEPFACLMRLMPEGVRMIKLDKTNKEADCGAAPDTEEEELERMLEL